MDKELFYNWLKSFKKLDSTTSNARTSNCLRIEKFYGDLDKIYNSDRCISLIEQLTYTTTDKKLGAKPKHNIPIDGDIYNGTHTLKAALKLYIEFKDNKMIEELKTIPDVDPDKHDGSYELVRETVESLSTIPWEQLDINDLDLLYFMVVGTWRSGVDVKRQKIKDSHLDTVEKDRLSAILEKVKEKAVQHSYENIAEEGKNLGWSIGMFGTGFHTFASKADKESAQRFISLCVELKDMADDEAMFVKVDEAIKKGIKGMQSAAASVMLHCLKPYTFPIMNSAVNDTASLFQIEGVSLVKPKELGYYIQNSRQLKKFRDEKCIFRNYRAMDMKLSVYGRSKDIVEEESVNDTTITQDDKINIWKISHGNDGSFSEEEREKYFDQGIITVHRDTGRGQGNEFENGIKIGDYFYLCYGNSGIKLLGKITSEAVQLASKTQGWLYRNYEVVAYSKIPDYQYSAAQKGWTPNYNSTAWRVPRNDYAEFEKNILLPCFDKKVQDLISDEKATQPDIKEDEPSGPKGSLELYTKEDFLNEVFISEQQYDEISILLNRKKNIILQGAPGVGKTFAAKRLAYSLMGSVDDSRIEMVQFHQNYSYEDFVMGFRPVEGGGFELRNGIFHQFCIKAANDPNRDYYFIIDEINRGNLSKIFGELLMLIENDKRGSKFAVPLTYKPDSRFYVPQNIFIIGMMNTADRSLAMIDYALRRRFCFVEIEPAFNTQSFRKHLADNGIHVDLIEKIISRLMYLNSQIASDSNLGRGFRIGHSYFCNPSTDENWYQSVIEYEINPLIEEYWFDNEEKAQEYMDYLLG
jgi:MoxR-like ATPase